MLDRKNRFDLDYGDLTGSKSDGSEYIYINNENGKWRAGVRYIGGIL